MCFDSVVVVNGGSRATTASLGPAKRECSGKLQTLLAIVHAGQVDHGKRVASSSRYFCGVLQSRNFWPTTLHCFGV